MSGGMMQALERLHDENMARSLQSSPNFSGSIRLCPQPLEDLLLELAKWGQPNLCQMGSEGGWYCWVDVKVNASGVDFKVKSGTKHTTPHEAVIDCHSKLATALKGLGVQA